MRAVSFVGVKILSQWMNVFIRDLDGIRVTTAIKENTELTDEILFNAGGEFLDLKDLDRFVVQLLVAAELIFGHKSTVLAALLNQRRNKTGKAVNALVVEATSSAKIIE